MVNTVFFFRYHMSRGLNYENVLSKYSDNLVKNDYMVSRFVKKIQPCVCISNMFSCAQHVQTGNMFIT